MSHVLDLLLAAWQVLVQASPSLLLGFLIAGLLHELIPADRVLRLLGGTGLRPILMAAAVGIPLPLCSCSVIPAAAELRRKGAGRGAVATFLVATPETGVDSIAVSFALLHPLMALFRPLAALVTAVTCGLLVGRDPAPVSAAPAPIPGESAPRPRLLRRLVAGVRYGFTDLFRDTAPWLLPTMVVSGALVVFLSPEAVARHLPSGLWQMAALGLLGIPLYVCATAATPLAAALVLAGFTPGAALVFLLTGPATNLATIAAVRKLLGPRAVAGYLASILFTSVGFGLLLDALLPALGVSHQASAADPRHGHAGVWDTAAAAAVLALVVWHLARSVLARLRPARKSCCNLTLPAGSAGAPGAGRPGAGSLQPGTR